MSVSLGMGFPLMPSIPYYNRLISHGSINIVISSVIKLHHTLTHIIMTGLTSNHPHFNVGAMFHLPPRDGAPQFEEVFRIPGHQ
jgi:hypothetical protein